MLQRCSLARVAAASRAACWTPTATIVPSLSVPVRHATSKAGGSTKNGRDSQPKFLGVKKYGGHWVDPGNIILRQRGQRYGIVDSTSTVAFGKDWTIYALKPGYVHFWYHTMKRKYFLEVILSPPGSAVIEKYPIVRVKPWEVSDLLRLPADTPLSDTVRGQLVDYLRTIPLARLSAVLPRGEAFIGDVQEEFWGDQPRLAADADGLAVPSHAPPGAAAAALQ